MSKINEEFTRILWVLCLISILCFTSFYFYKSSTPIGILEYLWLGGKSIFTTILSILILMTIIDFLSILLERKYYKANITSAKMQHLKSELDAKYSGRTKDEIKKEIKYITNENISYYLRDKLNLDFFSDGGNKLGCLGIGYFIYWGILTVNTPKRFFEIYEFVETRNWFSFFIILIAGISIFIYKLIRPNNEMKFIAIWIFSIIILAGFLYFTKPSYIDIYNFDELLWSLGCIGFISSLSFLISKAVK
jgi:hypothetical protein